MHCSWPRTTRARRRQNWLWTRVTATWASTWQTTAGELQSEALYSKVSAEHKRHSAAMYPNTASHSCSTRRRDEDSGSARSKLCGRNGAFAWLTQTQLCPVIWAIVIGLLVLFVFKASQQTAGLAAAGLRH